MALGRLALSSLRRDILTIATVISLVAVIVSFRNLFAADSQSLLPAAGDGQKVESKTDVASLPYTTSHGQSMHHGLSDSQIDGPLVVDARPRPDPIVKTAPTTIRGCENSPNTDDILLVMKTGATEAYEKLPIHLLTTLKCINDSIIFSDMEMNMAGRHLIDTLDEISKEIMDDNADFDLYRTLQDYHRLGEDPRLLKAGPNGWNLDKYKFTHMLLKTYRYRPNAPWYVFVEADTTLILDNLRTLLNKYHHTEPYYFGSPAYLDIEFAHGGTGYIISQAAMQAAVGNHPDLAKVHDKEVRDICCGDRMIAAALLQENIPLTRAWPMLNGEKPTTIPFSEGHWCQPVITMHHLTSQEQSQVWNFVQERKEKGITQPLLFREIFDKFASPHLLVRRTDWSNLSEDLTYHPPSETEPDSRPYNGRKWSELSPVEQAAPENADKCNAACDEDDDCWQWMHHGQECKLHRSVRLGGTQRPEEGKQWVSGWKLEKIEELKRRKKNCEDGADWTFRGI